MIKNNRELKEKYELLLFVDAHNVKHKHDEWVKQLKQEIRDYNNYEPDTRYIDGDYDGYLVLIEFPAGITMTDAEEYFMNNYFLQYIPSMYDCTGQEFTTGYKFCERHGRVYCYHSVSLDV